MKKLLLKILVLFFAFFTLVSCTIDSLEKAPAFQDPNAQIEFWIDTNVSPGSYLDSEGVWHVKYSGLKYFTIKGSIPTLNPEYVINKVPLLITSFDSDYFYIPGVVTWRYPVYSYRSDFVDRMLKTAIPVGFRTYTFPQLIENYTIMNLAGYQINKNPNVDITHPAYPTYFSTYSKYNYHPQQQMVLFPDFIGEKVTIFISVDAGEGREVVKKDMTIIFE